MDLMTRVAAGPFAAACLLLALAGVGKIRRPDGTRPAAAALGLPDSPWAVRALGLGEIAAAVAGIAFGRVAAGVVAGLYAALSVAAWRLYVRAPDTPCGCIGASSAPASAPHIAVNLAAMLAATLATAAGSPVSAVGHDAWLRVAFIVLIGCCAALVDVVIDTLPALGAAVHEGRAR
jgi:hypothetical protein